ncbi:phosphatase PAP2 family protein [Geobacter pickeringii]|uniref:Phosphoesterase n=1 Tax=Geobacter pickeringii TaxID=345632 RepID=A0A0B5BEU3_9BACT|nr:phosphatase PAP2 family protein [Geobacter pickeringii]AJE03050.1 phosphoesterase [Geobacter pickeringii]
MWIWLLVAVAMIPGTVRAEGAVDEVKSFVVQETGTLGNEALEFAVAPFRTDDGALLGTLAVAGTVGLTYVFDNNIREKVAARKGHTLDKATDAGNIIGNPILHLGVAGAVWGGGILADSPKWRDVGLMMGEAAVIADAATLVLKEAVGRSRPFTGNGKESFRPFQFKSDYDSMPSMHTASSFAMASVIARTSESIPVGLLSYTTAAFVGFSRIYQDKHWASDVVLGAAIGELAGRVVTRFHAGSGKLAVVPAVSTDSASLALVGKF